jgi:hypothetical protein
MSDSSRRCMLLAEIGNEYMREEHIAEIEQRTTLNRDDRVDQKQE